MRKVWPISDKSLIVAASTLKAPLCVLAVAFLLKRLTRQLQPEARGRFYFPVLCDDDG